MKTLLGCYKQHKDSLLLQLQPISTISEASAILQNELRRLGDINGEYVGSLNKSQARVALSMIEALRLSFRMLSQDQAPLLKKKSDIATNNNQGRNSSADSANTSSVMSGLAGGGIGGALVGGALAGEILTGGVLVGGVLGGVSGAVVATVALNTLNQVKPSLNYEGVNSSNVVAEEDVARVVINKDSLLSYLEQIFDLIDSVVAEYSYAPQSNVSKTSLESQPELLEFFQNFIGEVSNLKVQLPPIFEVRLQELNSILRRNGIRIMTYEKSSPNEAEKLFEFEQSLDPNQKHYVVKKPALIKGNEVLLRGRVVGPAI